MKEWNRTWKLPDHSGLRVKGLEKEEENGN